MYFLVDICSDPNYQPIWTLVGTIIKIIWIGIPILLIILGSVDLGKAVIASKEDEVKKAKQAFIRRLLYAVAVFAVVWLVRIVLGFVSTLNINKVYNESTGTWEEQADVNGWSACWKQILK